MKKCNFKTEHNGVPICEIGSYTKTGSTGRICHMLKVCNGEGKCMLFQMYKMLGGRT